MKNNPNSSLHVTALFARFSHGVNWNGIFYVFGKSLSTCLSFLLFNCLTAVDFATWANINSVVFLILLWIDGGLRKSIPRFSPEYAQSATTHKRFITSIIIWQLCILILSVPMFLYMIAALAPRLGLERNLFVFYVSAPFFIIEGMVAVLRLIYHAHFWNKQFNIISSAVLTVEMLCIALTALYVSASFSLLCMIILIKTIGSLVLVMVAAFKLPNLYRYISYKQQDDIPPCILTRSFIKHTIVLWAYSTIKSLSERNFILPVITCTLGPSIASTFKVANDGALFFYRLAFKTIGTADTALLSHAQTSSDPAVLSQSFVYLTKKVTSMCVPLFIIVFALTTVGALFVDPAIIQVFFIITTGYLVEAMLSPYERILEVKQQYGAILIAYIPYILGMIALSNSIYLVGLIKALIIIQTIRIGAALIMTACAHKKYALPLANVRLMGVFLCVTLSLGSMLIQIARRYM